MLFSCYANMTAFRDAETSQTKTKMVGWNATDMASGTIVNVLITLFFPEFFFIENKLNCMF